MTDAASALSLQAGPVAVMRWLRAIRGTLLTDEPDRACPVVHDHPGAAHAQRLVAAEIARCGTGDRHPRAVALSRPPWLAAPVQPQMQRMRRERLEEPCRHVHSRRVAGEHADPLIDAPCSRDRDLAAASSQLALAQQRADRRPPAPHLRCRVVRHPVEAQVRPQARRRVLRPRHRRAGSEQRQAGERGGERRWAAHRAPQGTRPISRPAASCRRRQPSPPPARRRSG